MPAQKLHSFYESNSKYISLKKFTDEMSFNGTLLEQSIYQGQGMKNTQSKDISLQRWFEKLLSHEKAIVMTIVDQDLVNLIKSMYVVYSENGHGHFVTEIQKQ